MVTDGCVIMPGAKVERSVLSPGVRVETGAVVRESIILTECVIGAEAVVEHSILDKRATIGEGCRIGSYYSSTDPVITMIGKNSIITPHLVIECGAVIGTDVCPDDFASDIVRGDEYIQTKRLAYEV
jgi:glucose-1-phosphate adenylyltransferase